jgi:hypothetical protein
LAGVSLAGSIGFGLVWGWLTAGLDGGLRGAWTIRLGLAGASFLAGLTVWILVGWGAVIAVAAAAVSSALVRLAWHREIAARSGHSL